MSVVVAPWTEKQVEILEKYQNDNRFHSYTCADNSEHVLVPTEEGWVCPECDYRQDWCYAFHFQINL